MSQLNSILVPLAVIGPVALAVCLGPVGRAGRAALVEMAGDSEAARRVAMAVCRSRYVPLIRFILTERRIKELRQREREDRVLSSL